MCNKNIFFAEFSKTAMSILFNSLERLNKNNNVLKFCRNPSGNFLIGTSSAV